MSCQDCYTTVLDTPWLKPMYSIHGGNGLVNNRSDLPVLLGTVMAERESVAVERAYVLHLKEVLVFGWR